MPSWNISGLILTECTHTPRILRIIEVAGIPVVELMGSQSPCLDITVGSDSFEATRQMATAIIAHGRCRIAYLDTRLDEHTIIKQEGYEQAILNAGLIPYSVIIERSSSYSPGVELVRQAWREYPQLGGVFCTNGSLAVGATLECQRLGLKVPDDMAITGFHDHDTGQVVEPRLASMLTPREWMSSTGAERLLAHVRNEPVAPKMLDLGFTSSLGGSI